MNDTETVAQRMNAATAQFSAGMRKAAENASRKMAPLIRSINIDAGNDPQVESLSDFLLERDWPTTRISSSRRIEYRRRAARILSGDAAAIRETWPEAAYEIATHSDFYRSEASRTIQPVACPHCGLYNGHAHPLREGDALE